MKINSTLHSILCSMAILVVGPTLTAKAASPESKTTSTVSVNGNILTMIHYRSDSDFDPTERHYDLDGQTEGQAATFFNPKLTINASKDVRVFYALEMGWNAWSRNDPGQPNQFLPSNQNGLVIRHKEIWAEWRNSSVQIRAGFQHFSDKSRLFLDHWGGLLSADIDVNGTNIGIMIGQLPDNTYEGVNIRDDNFVTDSFITGITLERAVGKKRLTIDAGLYGLLDRRSVDRPLLLGTALAGIRYKHKNYKAWMQVVGQLGQWENSGIAGEDQNIQSWAAQLGVTQTIRALHWSFNVFALSSDDGDNGNDLQGAFLGSGKNYSRSVLLTEDETRDRYDNIDERIASTWGPFTFNRAGLTVSEFALGYAVAKWYQPVLVVAAGLNLKPENAFGHRFVGLETSLLQDFEVSDNASFYLNAMAFIPGQASALFVNDVDRNATQALFGATTGFRARF